MVVQTAGGERAFVEDAWIGKVVAIGDTVRLKIIGSCPRCVMTTLPQGDLPKDVGILRAAAQHNRANVGVYASVLQGGKVRRGDSLEPEWDYSEGAWRAACKRQNLIGFVCQEELMATEGVPSLYERLGGVYSIATVIDDFIDRIMVTRNGTHSGLC
jgi:MOSC domain